jgi:hypothetical protein
LDDVMPKIAIKSGADKPLKKGMLEIEASF